jgi:hypothetical protein
MDREMAMGICVVALERIRDTNLEEDHASLLLLDIPQLVRWYDTIREEHLRAIFDDDIGIRAALGYDGSFLGRIVTSVEPSCLTRHPS